MTDLLDLHKYFIGQHLTEGGVVADFTMGNGNDTLFLSRMAGESGRVYAFDIQEAALVATRERLEREGAPENYTLIHDSHHRLLEYIHEPLNAGMFNLGYLPGSGKKELTTKHETTLAAIEAAVSILAPDGIILIAVYPGHEEGAVEGRMIGELLSTFDRRKFSCARFNLMNSPTSPYFYLIEKSAKKSSN